LKIHETLQKTGQELIRRIKNWEQDLRGSNKAIQDFRDIIKRIAKKTTGHYRKQTGTPEHTRTKDQNQTEKPGQSH
jgi:hypothetical protein